MAFITSNILGKRRQDIATGEQASQADRTTMQDNRSRCQFMDLKEARRKTFTQDNTHNALYLYYDQGLSTREVSRILNMSVGAVQLRINKNKHKYPNRRRNADITDEFVERMRQLILNNPDQR
ncbi:uncharacterized protein BX663DRAFT_508934, partial [Cokeromyces recurvatus]|uniref:uncharacterized protein n=1 Tax=Cokeromyces recurvatus TaxID=90255 RepID=UPI002220F141